MIAEALAINSDVEDYIIESFPKTFREQRDDVGDLIGVPNPYTVQGIEGGFPEMYYWDSYFTNIGLLKTKYRVMAKHNTSNLLFLLDKFGYVPNASRIWGTDRSQPPYLSMMVRDVYEEFGDKEWLRDAVAKLHREYDFWTKDHGTPTGLSRHVYLHHEKKEKLIRFYDYIAESRLRLNATTNEEKIEIAQRYMAEAETGWDFNPRFSGNCQNFLPVDLNSNLHVYEENFAYFSAILKTGEKSKWNEAAVKRRELMRHYLWNNAKKTFVDYDYINNRHSEIVSAAMMHTLMAKVASEEDARHVVDAMARIECPFGIAACEAGERIQAFQWDYPNGWPPSQYATVRGLLNYGYKADARRVLEKYLTVIEQNYKLTGKLWEKYNVETGTLKVSEEYVMPAFLGWTAGVYLWGNDMRTKI